MKKIPQFKTPRLRSKKTAVSDATPSRITNETVAEHREKILAGGRKFKYPIQYARHKLVINTLMITAISIIVLGLVGWWLLYVAQNSSGFMYRVTLLVPIPVANVNGEMVRYSDYLVQYRGSEYYLSKYGDVDSADGKKTQLDYIKRQSMDKAAMNAYAGQIARQKNITVSDDDVNQLIDQQRNTANGRISQETYDASSRMMYNWSPSDYRLAVRQSILRTKVAFAVDDKAASAQKAAAPLVQSTAGDFAKVAEQVEKSTGVKPVAGQSGLVNTVGMFGGMQVSDVAKLEKGQVSGVIRSTTTDGYYFVKVIDKTDTQVNFAFLRIPLTKFAQDFADLQKNHKISEYIDIPKADNTQK